jgi:hypothetical protein
LNLHYIRFLDIADAIEKISLESLTGYQDAWFFIKLEHTKNKCIANLL